MNRLFLCFKLILRDARQGELTLLITALIIAVASSTAISLFSDRLNRTMGFQAAEFMAGDLVITSTQPIAQDWLNKARQLELKQARTAEFSSVLMENEEFILVSVKAVSDQYPLRGYLKTSTNDFKHEQRNEKGPEPGNAWVDQRILSSLKLNIGDTITVGEHPLILSRILNYETDKRGDLYSFSPRVMISDHDLNATQVIQPGSHVHYFFQFSGNEKAISDYNHWIKPQLNSSQRLMDINEDRPELGNALKRAERYLGLSSIIVVMIAGVAIAMATQRYSERHFDSIAILKCLGCTQKEIVFIFFCQFLWIGLTASTFGVIVGWYFQEILFLLLQSLLPASVATPSISAALFGILSGMAILFAFALPPLLRLRKVSALRVFRRELDPLPSHALLIFGLIMTLLWLLIWQYTDDLKLTATILGSGCLFILALKLLLNSSLVLLQRFLPRLQLKPRLALQNLIRNKNATTTQIMAFSLTWLAMILSYSIRTDLLNDWQNQLPEKAANHFVLNIMPDQIEQFRHWLDEKDITQNHFYPVIRGRLTRINGTGVQQIVSKESRGERATHRDLSLTWTEQKTLENKTAKGHWNPVKSHQLSIEKKLADSLKVDLGDQLTFTIGHELITAEVIQIRHVNWDSMKPNFYMIFSPGTLDNFATTYLSSFYLPAENKHQLNPLLKKFPNITLLEVDIILKQFNTILQQITQAINYLLYMALLAGFSVLLATLYASLDQRIYEATIIRTLGADKSLLRYAQLIEFCLLGAVSGLLAVFFSQTLIYLLYEWVLHMEFEINILVCIAVPLLSMVLICLAGYRGIKKSLNQPPIQVLADIN